MMRAAALTLILLASPVAVSAAENESGDPGEARRHYDRATRAYNLQDWHTALDEFRGSYSESGNSTLLFNIGQCQRQLGDYDAASRSYRAYLASLQDVRTREQIRGLIDQMDEAARAQRRLQAAPPPGTIAPGHTALSISGKPERRRWFRSAAGWTLASVGVASLAVAGGLLGASVAERNSALAAMTQDGFDAHHSSSVHYQQGGWPLLGIGTVAVVGSVIAFVIQAKGHHQ